MGRGLGDKSVPLKSVYRRRDGRLGSVGRDRGLRNLREDIEAQRILGPLPVSGLRQGGDEEESFTEDIVRLIYLRRLNPGEEVDEDCNDSSSYETLL